MARWLGRIVAIAASLLVAILLLAALLPGEWLARPLAIALSKHLQVRVAIASADVKPFSLEPSVDLSGVGIDAEPGSALLTLNSVQMSVGLRDILVGTGVIDRLRISGAQLQLNEQMSSHRDLLSLLQRLSSVESPVNKLAVGLSNWRIRHVLIDSMTLQGQLKAGEQSMSLQISGAASTDTSGNGTRVQIDGDFHGKPLLVAASLPSLYYLLNGFPDRASAEIIGVDARLGDSRLLLEGSIGKPAELHDVTLRYSLDISSSEDWQLITPVAADKAPPLLASGDVLRGSDEWLLARMDWQWGQTDLGGEVHVGTAGKTLSVDARLSSDRLHSEEAQLILSSEYPMEELVPRSLTDLVSLYGRLLPYLGATDKTVQGSVSYRVDRVLGDAWPVSMFDLQAEMTEDQLVLEINRIDLGNGLVEGSVQIRFDDTMTESSLDLYLKRFELTADRQSTDKPGRLAAHFDLRLTSDGVNNGLLLRDGHLQALAAGGDVSTILARLIGLEEPLLLTPAGVKASPTPVPVACSYADLQLQDDTVDIAALVVNTADAVVLGDGSLSWGDRSLDVMMESHATSAAAATAWHVGGLLSAPVRNAANPVLGRDTAAAVLADIVTPAATLMPFLDSGADASYSAFCSGMANALHGEP